MKGTKQQQNVLGFSPLRMRKSNFFSTATLWLGWWAEPRTSCSSGPGTLKAPSDPPSPSKPSVIIVRSRCTWVLHRASLQSYLRTLCSKPPLGHFFFQITIHKDEECELTSNSHRAKWKVISPAGNEAMVPSVCFTVPPPNKEAVDMAAK